MPNALRRRSTTQLSIPGESSFVHITASGRAPWVERAGY